MSPEQLTRPQDREETRSREPESGPPPATAATDRGRSGGGRSGAAVGWGIAFLAAGVLWILALLDLAIMWEYVLPVGVVLIGVALLLGVRGPVRGGLVGFGSALAAVALVGVLVPSLTFTAGDRTIVVDAADEIASSYELGAGTLTLDLRGADLPEGTTRIAGRVNFGELVVVVPPDVTVTGQAAVRVGEVDSFDRNTAGLVPSVEIERTVGDADRVLEVDLQVGFGRIEVRP